MAKTFLDFEGLTTYNNKIKDSYISKASKDAEFADYVKNESLTSTLENYVTETAIEDMLTKTEAESTYAKETAIEGMLTKIEASSTYVNNEKLTSQLQSQKTELQQEINEQISTVYKPQGSASFESLTRPPTKDMLGYVYNMTEQFTTDTNFLEGASHSYPAGTNIVVVSDLDTYKYDVLSGTLDLSEYVKETEITAIANEQIESLFNE